MRCCCKHLFAVRGEHSTPRPVRERDPGAVNVKEHVGRYYGISASGYIKEYSIPHSSSRRYAVDVAKNGNGPELRVDLNSEPNWMAK
jgi:hypothetical protein